MRCTLCSQFSAISYLVAEVCDNENTLMLGQLQLDRNTKLGVEVQFLSGSYCKSCQFHFSDLEFDRH